MIKKYSVVNPLLTAVGVLCSTVVTLNAATLLDDTWADASRDEQNLPTESQWFSSGGTANLTNVAAGSMTFIADPTSSRAAITYFATNGLPVTLADGQTIVVTLDFSVSGVVSNNSQSMRFALADYSAGTRVSADGGSTGLNGANVTGYGFFTHISNPFTREVLDIKERTGITSSDLLGSSSAWTNTIAQAYDLTLSGIANSTPYTMTFSVTRSGTDAVITNTLTGGGLDVVATGTHTNGWFSFDAFAFRNSGADETAATFVFTRMKVEGPFGTLNPPKIVSDPQDLTRTLGQSADFTVAASGASLSHQWYYTTNSTDTLLSGETNQTFSLPSVGYSDAGGYFAIVTNSVGSATSLVATLTVNAPAPTSPGVVMNDTWADGERTNTPITPTSSLWYASSSSSLVASTGSMLGTNISTSRLWVGYFTTNDILPVDLSVGNAMKVTLIFTPGTVATFVPGETTWAYRVGLFDYADGGTRLTADGTSSSGGNGANVLGYMFNIYFYNTYTDAAPIQIRARTDTANANLIGTTSAYTTLGGGPDGMLGLPGFQSGVTYTNEMVVTRTGLNEVEVACSFKGPGLDIATSVVDGSYAVSRYDAIAIRVNRSYQAADSFNYTQLKVEVVEAPVPPFRITSAESLSANSFKITWESIPDRTYQIQSRDLLSSGGWVTNDTVVAAGVSSSYTNNGVSGTDERYYRVVAP